ncbi:MAG: N-acetyltransferase family protein [Beduini sp.]|uniref:GNAT family N-acetyltransferase n=1 Tax=Beduini sp. TaxID=1922300 RepID=UPI0039A39E8B
MKIRYITPADDRMVISKIYAESWRYAYQGMIPQDYLNSLSDGQWIPHLANPNRKILLCMEGDIMVGTCSFSHSQSEQFKGWGEIISIYLLPAYMGKGYGKTLINFALKELKRLGDRKIFLWVLEENRKARCFYEKIGFKPTDDYLNVEMGGKEVREIRYIYED